MKRKINPLHKETIDSEAPDHDSDNVTNPPEKLAKKNNVSPQTKECQPGVENAQNLSATKTKHADDNVTDDLNEKKQNPPRWRAWVKQHFIEAFQECTKDISLDASPPDLELCDKILSKFPENPGITKWNVQSFIHHICLKEQRRQMVDGTPIDKWIEIVDAVCPNQNNVAKQMSIIMSVAKQEPSDDSQLPTTFDPTLPLPNYEEIYNYFSKAFSGLPLPELTPIDSLVVEDCMQSLAFQVESLNNSELRKSLRKVYLHLVQEPDEEQEADQEELKTSLIHTTSLLNPLGLLAEAIVPVVQKM